MDHLCCDFLWQNNQLFFCELQRWIVALFILWIYFSVVLQTFGNVNNWSFFVLFQAWYLLENNRELQLIDPVLSEFDEEEALRAIRVALLCTQASPFLRPPMSRVVAMLSGDAEVSIVTSKPSYLVDWHPIDSFMSGVTSRASTRKTCDTELESLSEFEHSSSWAGLACLWPRNRCCMKALEMDVDPHLMSCSCRGFRTRFELLESGRVNSIGWPM